MSGKTTRRSFLKGSAIAAGSVVGATVGAEIVTPLVVKEKMVFEPNTSIWASDQPPINPALGENLEVDLAIIGGGYTGLSAAYYIKKMFPEKNVVLFEAMEVGHGGSGRNGGMILPQPFNEYMQIFSDPKTHKRTYDVTVESMKELQDIISAQDIDCDFRLDGIILVIISEKQVKKFQEYSEAAKSLGIPIEFWDKEQTVDAIGTDVYHASLFEPNGGEVHPMKLVHALKKAAEDLGVKIYENSPVFEIEEGEVNKLSVGKEGYKVESKAIVLATNGYTSKLGYFKNRVFPFHAQVAITPPLSDDIFTEIGWKNRIPFSDTLNYLYHLGTTDDNRILIGGGNADYYFNNGLAYKRDVNEIYAILKDELSRIYPALSDVEFDSIWNGVLGFTVDFNQTVGVMGRNKNIYYGLAFCGHGVNLSFFFGKIIRDLYAGDGEKWSDMPFYDIKPTYLPPEPLRWLGVQGYMAFYRMLDKGME